MEQEEGSGWASYLFGEPVTPEYRRQARLFLFAGLVWLLAAYLVLAVVYSLPALACLRLGTLPTLAHWRWWRGFLLVAVLIALGLLSLAYAVVVVGRALLGDRRQKCFLRRWVMFVVLEACLLAFSLSLGVAVWWLHTALVSPLEAISTYIRAFEFLSGLSPVVPLVCVAFAGFLWAFCSFRRLRMIDGIRPASRKSGGADRILSVDTPSFLGIRDLEMEVRRRLERDSAFSKRFYYCLISVGPLAAVYLLYFPFVPSYEGLRFYFLYTGGFFLVYSALSLEFGRLCLVWGAFRHLLHHLALHPMRDAYERYRKSFQGLPRIDLSMPRQTFPALEFSIDQAERLLRTASSLVPSFSLSEDERQNLKSWIEGASQSIPEAAGHLLQALEANAEGEWRLAIEERSKSQQTLGNLAQTTAELLEPWWHAASSAPPPRKESPDVQEFRELAEEFLAGRTVLLISYVLPALRKLGTFILTGLLLMLFSVMFYPFVQKNHFLAFNWIVILAFVGLALVVMLQMERDVVLSALNGTKPGQVKVTRQFTFRILTYVMIPILALLSAQFPDTLGQIISWFTAAQGH